LEFLQKLGVQAPPVRIDSQAKYGALARGDGAIYLRFPYKGYREKIWDHAAGAIVVTGIFFCFFSNIRIQSEDQYSLVFLFLMFSRSWRFSIRCLRKRSGFLEREVP
jgi:hypothetical protein